MRAVAAESPSPLVFMICSDETVDLAFFRKNGMTVFAGPGHKIEDLAALSMCDKIMGAPSTYSWWAAFVAEIPLLHIWDASKPMTPDGFKMLVPDEWP